MLKRYLIVVLLTLLLSSCGFQLRGALNLSQEMSPLYLQSNSLFELGKTLRTLLSGSQVQVTEDVTQAKVQLVLLSEKRSQRVLSVDGRGRAKEYLLSYTVDFLINHRRSGDADEERDWLDSTAHLSPVQSSISHDLISHDSISVARSLLFDPDAVIAVTREADILYADMKRDVARLILLKLQASARQHTTSDNVQ